MNLADAAILFSIAHNAIESHLLNTKFLAGKLEEKAGIFVTLTKQGQLRGCVGFTNPVQLDEGARKATLHAASLTQDSRRFPRTSLRILRLRYQC